MKKLNIKNIKNSNGFVAIETLIVGGIVIASGTFLMPKLALKANAISAKPNNSLNISKQVQADNIYTENNLNKDNEKNNLVVVPSKKLDFEYKIIDDSDIERLNESIHNKDLLQKGTIMITKYNGTDESVVIPSEIDGKKVTAIDDVAFSNALISSNNLNLKIKSDKEFLNLIHKENPSEDEIEECLKYFIKNYDRISYDIKIGGDAHEFQYNHNEKYEDILNHLNFSLKSVTIPEGVTYIGEDAFSNNKLTSVTIPNSVKYLGGFRDNELKNVVIPNSVTQIGVRAFSNNKLTSVIIPDSVTLLDSGAFSDNQLNSVKLSNNITRIENVFNNNKLQSIVIPDSVTKIGNDAFDNNELTNVIMSKNIKVIEDGAFTHNKLTEIIIPNSDCYATIYSFDRSVNKIIK